MHTHAIAGEPVVSAAPAIRLLLVDDHGIVREGLRALLDDCDEFVIVGEATNGDEACEAVRRLAPDIVLMTAPLTRALVSRQREWPCGCVDTCRSGRCCRSLLHRCRRRSGPASA